ncbi:CMP-N-acetylneuraminate-poly-alpha-2,8-sialyltransferase-like [Strongylocentrotus purpuratus]|uniref:Uncharacterized protein n=1 Tax=Strongylocentrotus purpuratus TaxID=7668 RepID=A0A7M7P032_STRPU|nr:CMP-N-acetylneuraminate-poly-alpha-2,8-sialyltransferase-like [Strongylocentrotus purpuratus]
MSNCSRLLDDWDYDDDHLDSLAQNSTSLPDSGSHLLSPAAANNTKKISILGSLWSFKDINDEVLFLYEQLIINRNISANHTNTEIFRQELAAHRTELKDSSEIILHRENCQVNGSSRKLKRTSAELFSLFPKSDPFGLPQKKRYPSCAIVGNSGSILHSGCGERIDEHDFVIRCNIAPLTPFKEDAGMKSNYITMNPSLFYKKYGALKKDADIKKYNQDISQYGGMLSIPCFGMKQAHNARAISSFKGEKPTIVCMNGKHFSSVRDFWKKKGVIDRNPSTGFYLVSMAVQLCDEIDLYGFWPFSSRLGNNKTNVPYHYFDGMSGVKAGSSHQMNKEFSTLLQLHVLGILNLNIGSCS